MREGILDALTDTRVVYVMGARQVGKSTLVTSVAENEHPAQVRRRTLEEARADPVAFVRNPSGPMVIDEVQLVPELLRAVKREVDERPEPDG